MCDVFRPLQCYSSHSSKRGNIAKAPPPSAAAPPSPPPPPSPYRPRPGVVRMVPIKSIRLKYQRQPRPAAPAPPAQQHHLYKYKAKFAMRNILQRSRTGRLNKIQSSNINNI